MVGDGVNDAAAMARATVGIAVRGGAEASLAVADVYLSRPGLAPLDELMAGSERTLRVIRRNIALFAGLQRGRGGARHGRLDQSADGGDPDARQLADRGAGVVAEPDLRGGGVSVIFVVLPIALVLLAGAIAAFAWAARRGQFDDLTTPAMRALHDDDTPAPPTSATPTPP